MSSRPSSLSASAVRERAQRLADDVLFPAALQTDQANVLDVELLDALADAGFYGLTAPSEHGGLGATSTTTWDVIETLASGCLTTTFTWIQHLSVVSLLATAAAPETASAWLPRLASGACRGGVAFAHLRRPGPPALTAHTRQHAPDERGDWVLNGSAPWVTCWNRIDIVNTAARLDDGRIAWVLVDASASETLTTERLDLAAVNASATVVMNLAGHRVSNERVVHIEAFYAWSKRDAAGLRTNGSLALGVSSRALALLERHGVETTTHRGNVDEIREALRTTSDEDVANQRARACRLCVDVTSALVAAGGGSSIVRTHHAQRLAREATFLLVQGQTAAIKTALLASYLPHSGDSEAGSR